MGTPDFAIPVLKEINKNFKLSCVISQPAKKAKRGHNILKSPVQNFAEQNKLIIKTPNRIEDEYNYLKEIKIDLAVVVAYGQVIPSKILELSKNGFINIHASLLPKWRGAAPIQRSIMSGENITGITIMKIEKELDSGPILLSKSIKSRNLTFGQLEKSLSELGSKVIVDCINKVLSGNAEYIPQKKIGVSYAKKITKLDEKIDWNENAENIIFKINALNPKPGAYFDYKNEKIKVYLAKISDLKATKPGMIIDSKKIIISCKDRSIEILELQRSGKKIQLKENFILGFKFDEQI
tara:strand:+ start:52108 stop:52992 length:885 start_codon:yes stop_codon:yes gene_type:complete